MKFLVIGVVFLNFFVLGAYIEGQVVLFMIDGFHRFGPFSAGGSSVVDFRLIGFPVPHF